ncbi:hypothetical protein [Aliiglaciecola lipolytica]|uniref:Uncharacterized protein n=1 Tax=Aliiglaciecola lipolytica E3 TaxID=1127673 RepID=K6Y4U1_9ALTE|nr:hypothetical protein [Aliiglaciecola lipolytica]GAC13262.1 hypothetical protein GLIP_0616 [Aliiglaciecola lipolytica E3]
MLESFFAYFPKSAKLAVIFLSVIFSRYMFAFDGGEHALIGNLAFEKSTFTHPTFTPKNELKNLETDMPFNYGQVVAMSGDMYVSVEEIALSDPIILNGFFGRNRNSLKNCINIEIEAIYNDKVYSGCSDLVFAKKKLKYLTLAHDNYTHFAWHNIKKYVEFHTKALWFAKLAYLKCSDDQWLENAQQCEAKSAILWKEVESSGYREKLKSKYRKLPKLFPRRAFSQRYFIKLTKQQMIDLALFTNGYADHFLTDAFSAGHLRVPRSQIDRFVSYYDIDLVTDSDDREEGTSLSGALTQLLHNTDGYLGGTKVTNSVGNEFILRSDKQLFSLPDSTELSADFEQNNQLQYPVDAVVHSLQEVFNVVVNGGDAMPKYAYKALELVPFIENAEQNSLATQIQAAIEDRGATKKIIDQMSDEMSLLFKAKLLIEDKSYKHYLQDFVDSIPQLMAEFREQVTMESENELFKKRIPAPLLENLRQMH